MSADNPVEHVESYRGKRIFLVSGTESDRYASIVLPSQQSFEKALDGAGIGYEHTGAHIVRWGRIQQTSTPCSTTSPRLGESWAPAGVPTGRPDPPGWRVALRLPACPE